MPPPRRIHLGLALIIVGSLLGFTHITPTHFEWSTPVSACDPQRTAGSYPNYQWVGTRRTVSSGHVNGVKATLDYETPWVYPYYPELTLSRNSAWVQLVVFVTGTDGYAKAGWMRRRISYFAIESGDLMEWKEAGASAPFIQFYTNSNFQGTAIYEVRYNENPLYPNAYTFYRNGVKMHSGGGAYLSPATYQPTQANVAGQVDLLADQMPGHTNNYMNFYDVHVRLNGSTGWQSFSGSSFNSNSNEFGIYGYSQTWLAIWDKKCSYN